MPIEASNRCRSGRRALRIGIMVCLTGSGIPLPDAVGNEANVAATASIAPATPGGPLLASEVSQIDGRTIACRAAENWLPAKALRARARSIVAAYAEQDESVQQAAGQLASFLHHQACYQEDIGAASALRGYYARIAVQEQLQLSQQSFTLIESEQAKHDAALAQGLATGVDRSSFERRRLEIEDQQLQLHSQDRQLRLLVAGLTKLDYASDSIRQEQLDVRTAPLDCQQLQTIALQTRCDLRGWSNLACQTNEVSAPLIAQMLTTAIGGFGSPLPAITGLKSLLCPPDLSGFTDSLQRELHGTVDAQRRWICQTVEEKCNKLQLAYRRMDLAKQTIESWEQRLQQFETLEQLGDRSAEEHAAARVGLFQARAEEIARRHEARTAEIDLAEAVGGLQRRCAAGQPWLVTGYEAN